MATLKYEAVARLPEGKDGKKRYHKCGVVFESDKGLSLKLDSLPVAGFDGWISFYDPKPKDGAKPAGKTDPDEIPF